MSILRLKQVRMALIFIFIAITMVAIVLPMTASAEVDYISLPIAMYHSTANVNLGMYTVSPYEFEADIKYLKSKGRNFVVVADLIAYQEYGVPLPENPIMLTFDDGFMNNYLWMFPILKKHNAKCVISVIGNLTDANYKKNYEACLTYSHLTYEQMKEMSDSGLVEIQNHTYSMHGFMRDYGRHGLTRNKDESAEDYEQALSNNLMKLNDKVYERAGLTLTAVAYPYGSYSNEAIEIMKKLGFKAGFTCNEQINKITPTSNLFKLGRYNRPHGISPYDFFKKLGIN